MNGLSGALSPGRGRSHPCPVALWDPGVAHSRLGRGCRGSTSAHKSSGFGYAEVGVSPEDAVFPKSQEPDKLLQFKNESIY